MDHKMLQKLIRDFAIEREWIPYHKPKNLVMALSGEAGELVEIFQWLTQQQSEEIMQNAQRAEAVRDEMADVLLYLLRLADILEVDLEAASVEKMRKNKLKYPVHLCKGKALKYDQL